MKIQHLAILTPRVNVIVLNQFSAVDFICYNQLNIPSERPWRSIAGLGFGSCQTIEISYVSSYYICSTIVLNYPVEL